MKTLSIAHYSATGMEITSLSGAVSAFRDDGLDLAILAKTGLQLFDEAQQKDFVAKAIAADAVVISLHGGKASFPAFDLLVEALENMAPEDRPWIHIQPTSGDADSQELSQKFSTGFGSEDWTRNVKYLNYGGRQNLSQFLRHVHHQVLGSDLSCAAPAPPPCEGIYHPEFSGPPELAEYLAAKYDPAKITVGIWFHQTYWLNNNLSFIDSLIRSIEAQGANVLPVFMVRFKDAKIGNLGPEYVADHFFRDENGRPRIDVLLSPMNFSMNLTMPETKPLFPSLNVPVLQAIVCHSPREAWRASVQGLPVMDVSIGAAQPEFDGNLITVPFAFREEKKIDPITNALLVTYEADGERTAKLARLAVNWGRLRRTPVAERRVAIVFHHYPPRNDRIGCAAGLDSFASVAELLKEMKSLGYAVERTFEGKDELAHEILGRMTCDQRWLTPDQMAARAGAVAGADNYIPWHEELPEKIREKMCADWGEIPGELFVHEGKMLFAGLADGNVFISVQPPRGYLEQIDKIYHDLYLSPPHHYLAQYRWLRDVWGAHAVMHIGKHGSLEWLPGKGLGLSGECYPDLAIMELPNIYPYIINDPGEGTQAKRRSYACIIDHLIPAMTGADLYDDLAKTEALIAQYHLAATEDPAKLPMLKPMIWEAAAAANLHEDLELTEDAALADFDGFLEKLHGYLHELSDTMIADGLHTLGLPPEGARLTEFIVQLTRVAGPGAPSLREAVILALGFNHDQILASRGRPMPEYGGKSGADILREVHAISLKLVEALAETDFAANSAAALAESALNRPAPGVEAALRFIAETLVPSIIQCRQEIGASMNALAGGFVEPGPSGAPSRGQTDILPTGRNFYSVDPNKVPSPAAWKMGVALGDALIERCLEETGHYPENVGIFIGGSSTMRTRGDDVAQVLYLMGLRPVWSQGGYVENVEVIPLKELGRPRLDVTPRITGFFRDSFPNLIELLDGAVQLAAGLREPPESNFIRRHVFKDVEEYRAEGLSEDEAWREATFRLFGCPPGTYGAGVSELVETKQWQTQEDLGNSYIRFSGHAYGRGSYGLTRPAAFRRNLARMDVTVKIEDSREYDMMSCTDYYNYYGGLIVAAKTVRGKLPLALMGDSSDPSRVKFRTTFEEAKHVLRSRLVNPKWIEGIKRHGYKGAGDISHVMDILFGWDAAAEVMDDWMYEKVAKTYALDKDMKEWLKEVNPYALQNILDKLLEAVSRGMWQADKDMERELREAYLETEGELEEWSDTERAAV